MKDLLGPLRDDRDGDAINVVVDLSIKLRQIGHVVGEVGHAAQENIQELEVLALLYRLEEPYRTTPGILTRQLHLTSGALTARLDILEQAGHIRRERGYPDRRRLLVQLTEQGQDRVRDSAARLSAVDLGGLRTSITKR